MTALLPPQLPLLWRTPRTLQLGDDPGLSITSVPRLSKALRMLRRRDPVADVAARTGVSSELLAAVVSAAAEMHPPAPRPRAVAVVGVGDLADACVEALHCPVRRHSSVAEIAPDTSVVVAATGCAAVEPVFAAKVMRAGMSLLPVLVRQDGTEVGPLARPGSTSCPRCHSLARRDHDPAWPLLEVQLARTPLPLSHAAGMWAASMAASAIELVARGRLTHLDHAAWRWSSGEITVHEWPPHPDCCGADGLAVDGTMVA